jgi:hypothetical protein
MMLLAAACESAPPVALDEVALQSSMAVLAEPAFVPFRTAEDFAAATDAVLLACTPEFIGVRVPNRHVGGGVTSHLGLTHSVDTFDTCTLKVPYGTGATMTGHIVQTAANGDQLMYSYTMTQYPNGFFELDGITFTGGTGRFTNAIGSATGSGWINRTTMSGYWVAEGKLQY